MQTEDKTLPGSFLAPHDHTIAVDSTLGTIIPTRLGTIVGPNKGPTNGISVQSPHVFRH